MLAQANIHQGDPTGGNISSIETDNVVVHFADTFVLGQADTVCVRADWISRDGNYAISGPCDESDTTEPIIDREPDDPLYTELTYQCPTTKEGYLGVVNIGDDTRSQIWEKNNRDETIREVMYQDDPPESFDLRFQTRQEILRTRTLERSGPEEADRVIDDAVEGAAEDGLEESEAPEYAMDKTVDNVSELVEMEGEVTYTVRFDGEIETFAAPGHRGGGEGNIEDSIADCLVGIEHFGDDINLKNIVYLGGENLTSVPSNIPSSVVSLRGALENASNFNDPDIQTWDVSNVHTMRSLFHNTFRFNQDLSGWETGNLVHAQNMFSRSTAFNSDISGWDTESLVYANNMFANASSFNQDLSGWETENVINMYRMFGGATVFNQDLSGWTVEQVENHRRFSIDSALEDAHLPVFPEQ